MHPCERCRRVVVEAAVPCAPNAENFGVSQRPVWAHSGATLTR